MPLSIALKENKNTLTYSGKGSINDLDSVISKFKNVLVFNGVTGYKASGAKTYFKGLGKRIAETTTLNFFPYAGKSLPLEDIETIYKDVSLIEGADLIIAVGGGTVIDLAKVISIAYSNQSQTISEAIDNPELENFLDLLFIPTTVGTGSEGTSFAVLYKDKKKLSVDKKSLLPDYIVLDPELLKSLPDCVQHSTVLDALAQSIESIWAKGATIVSREYAAEAIELILTHFKKGSRQRLAQLQIGSHLAGRAINISRTTMAHSISYPFTAHFGIDHGKAVFLTLPQLAVLNYNTGKDQLQEGLDLNHIKEAFEVLFEASAVGNIEEFVAKLDEVTDEFGVPKRLSEYGVKESDLPKMAAEAMSNKRSQNNPRKINQEEVMSMLKAIL